MDSDSLEALRAEISAYVRGQRLDRHNKTSRSNKTRSVFLIGWLAGGRDVRPFGREDKPLVQCSISWCAVARSCLVQLFVPSEQAKKPGD